MSTNNKTIVTNFIEEVWNQNRLELIDNYLADDFTDHSLPAGMSGNKEGLTLWISSTGKAFKHQTIIEDIISEGDRVMVKISMQLTHIGSWREIEPAGIEVAIAGYRYFKIEDTKIAAHWALIDGNAIENALKESVHGCSIPQR